MVKYTRRHFKDIAGLLAKVPKAQRKVEAERYCAMFLADNPQFDKKKFLKACGL